MSLANIVDNKIPSGKGKVLLNYLILLLIFHHHSRDQIMREVQNDTFKRSNAELICTKRIFNKREIRVKCTF